MILLMNFVKIRIPQYVQFSLIFVYPKYRLMTCNTFSKILHVRYRIIISTGLIFTRENTFSKWIIFSYYFCTSYFYQILSKRNVGPTGRKLWTRFVKFDTFVYSHCTNIIHALFNLMLWARELWLHLYSSKWYITLI